MSSEPEQNEIGFVELTASIMSAYVANNRVGAAELPDLIVTIHSALRGLGETKTIELEKPTPLMPIKKTITPDHLISLEDGKRYKSLKRHLSGRGMTPADYRDKWGLAKDYPMVAPNYAKQRSELAKSLGLGQQRRKPFEVAPEPAPAPIEAVAQKKRGRPKAAKVTEAEEA